MSDASGAALPRSTPGTGAEVFPIPPPAYYAAAFAVGRVLSRVSVPLPVGGRPATSWLGAGVLAAGAALSLAGAASVLRRHTTIVPHGTVSTLLTTGIYRISRNPMYTGMSIAYIGGALLTGSWWPLTTLPPTLLAIRRFVIDPEERYLAERFGNAYAEYRARTRRWL
jgi:protein-S-isoprenylcysteine O-methyltransferase Ste14